MFNRLKKVVSGAVEGFEDACNVHIQPMIQGTNHLPHKHEYSRPAFLHTSNEALSVAKDKKVRLILSTSGAQNSLENNAAYAECINAGKSTYNEDMAQVYKGTLRCEKSQGKDDLHYSYYAIFDGHAGFGAALDASKQLHHILHQKLVDAQDYILAAINIENTSKYINDPNKKTVSVRDLIIGCLETSFCEMDEVIKESRYNYYNPGGCTALVALIISGDLYVANAGDCRAGIVNGDTFVPMSNDFSPYYDKTRIYETAASNTALLGDFYTVREFLEKPGKHDLGKNVLYKDPYMSGWSLKTLTSEDLLLPLVMGVGRRSRIMGTIGVARGFGDFDLTANLCKLPIKPLLSCVPEVKVHSLAELEDDAVFVMGSDGMWDAMDVNDVLAVCKQQRENHSVDARNAHVYTALSLVGNARGKRDNASGMWLLKNQSTASMDDITVFVVPLGAGSMMQIEEKSEANGSTASDESMSDTTHPLSLSSSSNELIDIDGQEVTPLTLL
ncbi:protein phosphatase 1J [Atheta coriaria]|uniref:protein phosphatase 1J n=1 Tax=Dalotia coriaria TaxID=877792 RepID=UPI0031F36205